MPIESMLDLKDYDSVKNELLNNKSNSQLFYKLKYKVLSKAIISLKKDSDTRLLDLLIEVGIDINEKLDYLGKDSIPTDLLGFSINQKIPELTHYLLLHDADPNSVNDSYYVLTSAVSKNDISIVKSLLEKGAILNRDNQPSLINMAIINNNVEMVNLLISKGATIQLEGQSDPLLLSLGISDEIADIILSSSYKFTLSKIGLEMPVEAFSIYNGLSKDIYEKIIKKMSSEIDINYPVEYGLPAIHRFVMSGNIEFIDILLNNGMDIEKKIIKEETRLLTGCSPLFLAVHVGKEHLIRYLVEKGAEINTSSEKYISPLVLSLYNKNERIFSYLLEHNASFLDVVLSENNNEDKLNIIHYAIQLNDPDMIESLINAGEDINRPILSENKILNGSSPLMLAVHQKADKNIVFLIDSGADVNYKNPSSHTALSYAALSGDVMQTEFLLKCNADPDIYINENYLFDMIENKKIRKIFFNKLKKIKGIKWTIKNII